MHVYTSCMSPKQGAQVGREPVYAPISPKYYEEGTGEELYTSISPNFSEVFAGAICWISSNAAEDNSNPFFLPCPGIHLGSKLT